MNAPQKQGFGASGWTPQAIEILIKMRSDGESLENIARVLGITRSSASGKASRLKLTPNKQKKSSPKPRPPRLPLPARKPPTPPAPPLVLVCDPVALPELRDWHCHAVLAARDAKGRAMYCGRSVTTRVNGQPSSWCAEHYALFMDLERMDRRHG